MPQLQGGVVEYNLHSRLSPALSKSVHFSELFGISQYLCIVHTTWIADHNVKKH